jgi:hypothetical protein
MAQVCLEQLLIFVYGTGLFGAIASKPRGVDEVKYSCCDYKSHNNKTWAVTGAKFSSDIVH